MKEEKEAQCQHCMGTGKIVYGSDTEGGRESVQCPHEGPAVSIKDPSKKGKMYAKVL